MKPCKYLDFDESKYRPGCEIRTLDGFDVPVRYWFRGPAWTQNTDGSTNPAKVQFCGAGRGRINGIFQCYQAGEMSCYEPETGEPAKERSET